LINTEPGRRAEPRIRRATPQEAAMALSAWRGFIRRNIVDTVPDAMEMCLSCGRPACSAVEFAACAPRLARAEALRQEREAEAAAGPDHARAPGRPPR